MGYSGSCTGGERPVWILGAGRAQQLPRLWCWGEAWDRTWRFQEAVESVRDVQQRLFLFLLLSLKNPSFTSWWDLKIWNTCLTVSSQLNLPYGVIWEGYMCYLPILGAAVCGGLGCSCHGKEERVKLVWVVRVRTGLLTFEQSLRDEWSKLQLLLQEGIKTKLLATDLDWFFGGNCAATKFSVGTQGCTVIPILCLLQKLFYTVPEVCHPIYLLILMFPKASCAISNCKT